MNAFSNRLEQPGIPNKPENHTGTRNPVSAPSANVAGEPTSACFTEHGGLVDVLVPYIKAGLDQNEFCIWVTSQPLSVSETVGALKEAVPDLNERFAQGQLEDSITASAQWDSENSLTRSPRRLVERTRRAVEKASTGCAPTANMPGCFRDRRRLPITKPRWTRLRWRIR